VKRIIFSILTVFMISGCARLLLPYHEHALCEKGYESGYCGSVKQVYEESLKQDKENSKETHQCVSH